VLEQPDLAAFFLDLAVLPDAATALRLMVNAMGFRGDSLEALEAALVRVRRPVLLCLDNAQAAVAAGWGADLLERLARLARRSLPFDPDEGAPAGVGSFDLMLVAVAGADPLALSEPFAPIRLGAVAPSEVRLLAEAYLDESGVAFAGGELAELGALSAGHPAYLQRAAFHLFEAKARAAAGEPPYNWRAAYLAEARERPVPGAPLPPEVFRGEGATARDESQLDGLEASETRSTPEPMSAGDFGGFLLAVLPVMLALLALQLGGGWLGAALVLLLGYGGAALWRRHGL
jgi:hypothetical protein